MNRLKVWYMKRIREIWFVMGLIIVLFLCIPYLVLGQHSFIDIHDQLDGEILNYIYRAKYLFSDSDVIPEFMNGMDKSSMTVPAPAAVLFFKIFSPFVAFALLHVMSILVGYIGMYALSMELTKRPFISFGIAVLFAYLPFYPVYGLSCYGQPLLIWAFIQLFKKKRIVYSMICIVLYGVFSSLALVGFVWLGLTLLFAFLEYNRNKYIAGGFGVLLCSYVIGNLSLLKGTQYAIHREEMVVYASDNLRGLFAELFLHNSGYCRTDNTWIFVLVICILIFYPLKKLLENIRTKKKQRVSSLYIALIIIFLFGVLLVGFGTIWQSNFIVNYRNELGGFFKYFQFNRVTWLMQTCWYIMLAISLSVFLEDIDLSSIVVRGGGWRKLLRYVFVLSFFVILSGKVYENSTIWHNLRLMIFPDTYKLENWESFYSQNVYKEIEEFIGKEKSSYRVVSLGVSPAVALYNGFYCLDGYSNYYSLEYKHEFRKIIKEELDKNEICRLYFDQWGNRCYLMNDETGYNMWITKYFSGSYKELNLNVEHLYAMGGKYVFSALPIENASEIGLTLARETPFEDETCMYRIYLYEVNL